MTIWSTSGHRHNKRIAQVTVPPEGTSLEQGEIEQGMFTDIERRLYGNWVGNHPDFGCKAHVD
jgi:hypothetical protein